MSEPRDFSSPEYKTWRRRVYSRDRHQCQMPGCGSGMKLNAHHIVRWADAPTLRFIVSNGITLCHGCHDSIWNREDEFVNLFRSIVDGKSGNSISAFEIIFEHRKRRIEEEKKRKGLDDEPRDNI